MIVNQSALPVYDVKVEVYGPEGGVRTTSERSTVPPGPTFLQWPQGTLREVPADDESGGTRREGGGNFRVAVTFHDTAGRVWRRDQHGRLDFVKRIHDGSASGTFGLAGQATGEVTAPEQP
jgi:hypothetical protein